MNATAVDQIAELDRQLSTPEFFAEPSRLYHTLREKDPVHWSDVNGGWMLTRYDDVIATIKDSKHFSSQRRNTSALERVPADERAQISTLENHFSVGLINSDPPDHTRMRALVNMALTPRAVERLRERVKVIVAELLDAAMAEHEFDIIASLAYPLPAIVIAELMGAPREDRDRFKVWSRGIFAFQGTGKLQIELAKESQRHLIDMREFLADLAEQRRREPKDDLVSALVAAEAQGDRLSEAELLSTGVTLLTAGHETTTNLIANGIYTLLTHPDQLALLRRQPELMPSAIEEMLRFETPLQRNPRRIARPMELRGKSLQSGEYVMQVLAAANRDPAQFPDPDRFDITRQPNRHIAFGFGVHFCVGAPLARLEAPIAIDAVLRRMPDLRLAEPDVPPAWIRHGLLRGLERLPLEW